MAIGFVVDTTRPRYGDWTFGWWSTGAIQQSFQATLIAGLPIVLEGEAEPELAENASDDDS